VREAVRRLRIEYPVSVPSLKELDAIGDIQDGQRVAEVLKEAYGRTVLPIGTVKAKAAPKKK
jgi:hypothetical protein